MPQASNVVLCKNRVVIEDIDVGQFESLSLNSKKGFVGMTGIMTLPSYAIGITSSLKDGTVSQQQVISTGSAKRRVRSKIDYDTTLKVGAKVEIECWYESPQFDEPLKVFKKEKVFSGFIERITEGFPTKIYLRDATYILKFGSFKEAFNATAKLSEIIRQCANTGLKAFKEYRNSEKLKSTFTFDFSRVAKGLQLDDTDAVACENFASGRTPFQVVEYLARTLSMHAGCTTKNELFFGYFNPTKAAEPTAKITTKTTVISRNIVATPSRFNLLDITVTTTDANGKVIEGKAGSKGGMAIKKYVPQLGSTVEAQKFAEQLLTNINGTTNEGDITLLLYPKVDWLDVVRFDDTVFEINNGQYFVKDYTFTANERGYYQKIGVTNLVLMV